VSDDGAIACLLRLGELWLAAADGLVLRRARRRAAV